MAPAHRARLVGRAGERIRLNGAGLFANETARNEVRVFDDEADVRDVACRDHRAGVVVEQAHAKLGFEGGADVQVGEYSAFPHGSVTPQVIREGSVVLFVVPVRPSPIAEEATDVVACAARQPERT